MPVSLAGNPAAFLRGAGGVSPPAGGMLTGPSGAPSPGVPPPGTGAPGGMPDMDSGAQGGPLPPELFQMQMAGAIAPQVLAQQQSEYFKRFLKTIGGLLREFMRTRGVGPKTVSTVGRAVTALESAMNLIGKEHPEEAGPVESLLASSLMKQQPMSQAHQTLPVMGPFGRTQIG